MDVSSVSMPAVEGRKRRSAETRGWRLDSQTTQRLTALLDEKSDSGGGEWRLVRADTHNEIRQSVSRSGGGEGGTSQADAQHERAAEAARERDEGGAADLSMPAGGTLTVAFHSNRATQQHEGRTWLNLG